MKRLPKGQQLKVLIPSSLFKKLRSEKVLQDRTIIDLTQEAIKSAVKRWKIGRTGL